jgi:hypothetical protein
LSIESDRERFSDESDSTDDAMVLDALLNQSPTNSGSDDSSFDPSRSQPGPNKYRQYKAISDKIEHTSSKQDIAALFQQLERKLLEKEAPTRRRGGRKPRVNQEVETIKRTEENDVRLQILVRK